MRPSFRGLGRALGLISGAAAAISIGFAIKDALPINSIAQWIADKITGISGAKIARQLQQTAAQTARTARGAVKAGGGGSITYTEIGPHGQSKAKTVHAPVKKLTIPNPGHRRPPVAHAGSVRTMAPNPPIHVHVEVKPADVKLDGHELHKSSVRVERHLLEAK